MKTSKKDIDNLLDQTLAAMRTDEPDAKIVDAVAERVWARISGSEVTAAEVVPVDQIRNCQDFQSLIPAYLRGNLTSARNLLFEDHTRECLMCRKALKAARTGQQLDAKLPQRSNSFTYWRWVAAATVFLALTALAIPFISRTNLFGTTVHANVAELNGNVYRVNKEDNQLLNAGAKIAIGEFIRTGKDADAIVRLNDGSEIEMDQRAEFSINENGSGITLNLKRGRIIVHAAKQNNRHLYVHTDDSLISVTGTIFAVNNGTKGSRVSVIDGEVHLDHDGKETVLHAGEQDTTNTSIERVSLKDEVAWSRNADKYLQMLAALTALGKDLNALPNAEARYSTQLLDLMPQDTVFYVALPNLSATLSDSYRLIQERITQNPALREWWQTDKHAKNNDANLQLLIEKARALGSNIGNEIVIGVQMDAQGSPQAPLVITEVKDVTTFRTFVEQQFAELSKDHNNDVKLQFIDDPNAANGANEKNALFIWLKGNLMIASPSLSSLQSLANNNSGFTSTPFYGRIAEVYQHGVGLIIAADLEKIVAKNIAGEKNGDGKSNEIMKMLGITDLKQLIVEQRSEGKVTYNRATITFTENQHGITSWLAAPNPMGTLDYISPDANVVAAAVVKEPTQLVNDLFSYLGTVDAKFLEHIKQVETTTGFDVQHDFAAAVGGEFAFAIDGPILPSPSWKMVFEVYDSARLQQSLEKLINQMNQWSQLAGQEGFTLQKVNASGRTGYVIKSLKSGFEINYAFVNGYMIMAANQGLIDNAIRYRESGYTLVKSPRFIAALPEDGNTNFSGIFYHDLSSLAASVANSGFVTKGQQDTLNTIASAKPTLACAYAYQNRMVFAINTEGPFGLNANTMMLGMPGPFGIQQLLQNTMKPSK